MADKKLSALTVATTMAVGDYVPFTATPGGTPASKNITKENFFKYLALGSDADGDIYYRAAGVLARLAKGAANLRLFMNAGATAPEWANGMKLITSTRAMDAATGDVAYTGVGFKPSMVLNISCVNSTAIMNIGIKAGADKFNLADYGSGTYFGGIGAFIRLYESSTKYQSAELSAYDADGFTLSWTRAGVTAAGTAVLAFLCFR